MGILPKVDGRAPIHLFASTKSWIEGNALHQLEQVAALPGVEAVAAIPDLHPDKYGPVGCTILADRLYPQFVGSDIGCGMGLFRLDVPGRKLRLDKLAERIRSLGTPWDGDFQSAIAGAGLSPTASDASLGSIGGGNHFCEFQMIDQIIAPDVAASAGLDPASAYLLVHSESRGFGHAILERHLARGGATLDLESEAAACYLAEHDRAVRWARLNRQIIAERAADAGRADFTLIADLSHNLTEVQPSGPSPAKVLHRKGAASSDRGLVPVPGSRGTLSYLVEPLAATRAETLASLAHGAGRKYDRASMHGRIRAKKSDLARLQRNPFGGLIVCEDRDLLVEEAPDAYKSIDRVIADLVEFDLARVVATFRPLLTFKTATNRPIRNDAKRLAKPHREDRR